ncbi:hypothetical protein B484DRAFT_406103 [Ochromonadaceae sp. CCMP2298]|nr:hypothetical protein B484DRAFT_406103 [Ochromonadaceae sp. CCMP2298]
MFAKIFLLFVYAALVSQAAADSLRINTAAAAEVKLDKSLLQIDNVVKEVQLDIESIPVDDARGARIAKRLRKSLTDGHKASKAVRAKGVTLFTPSANGLSRRLLESADGRNVRWDGFTQIKQRPNADCSGFINTIQGLQTGLCYQDASASSWIRLGCGSKNNKRALAFYQYALGEGGCTGRPISRQVARVVNQCALNYKSLNSTSFSMTATACSGLDSMDDGKAAYRQAVYDNKNCRGKPLRYQTVRLNACSLDVDFNNEDDEDETITADTTFQYVKYTKCDSRKSRGTVVAYSDSGCKNPIFRSTFPIEETLGKCLYTGEGSSEPFEGDYVRMICYNP